MSNCPVCNNAAAEVTPMRRVPGATGGSIWSVKCPACPVPFEIPGQAMNDVSRNPRQHEHRRRQWAEFLRGAVERGEKLARLY